MFIGAILVILLGSHLGNIRMKSESHWAKGLGGIAFKGFKANYLHFSIFCSASHFVYQSGTNLAILIEGHLSNIPIKFERNWPGGIQEVGI